MILPPPTPTLSDRLDDVLRYLARNRLISRPKKRGRWYLPLTVMISIAVMIPQIHGAMEHHVPPAVAAALVAIPLAAIIDAAFASYKECMDEWSSERGGPGHAAWRALVVTKLVLVGIGLVGAALIIHGGVS